MNQFTFRYCGESRTDSFPAGTTLNQMIADSRLQANLRFDGKRVEAHIQGFAQPGSLAPQTGAVITFQDKATEKHVS